MSATTDFGLTEMELGQPQKVTTYNSSIEAIVSQIAALLSLDVSGSADVTLTDTDTGGQSKHMLIDLTGTLTGDIHIIVPDRAGLYRVLNSTSGAFSITLKTSAGNGVVLRSNALVLAYCDGTDVLLIMGFNGAYGYAIDTESGTFTVTAAHGTVLMDASGGDCVADLEDATTCPGRIHAFKRADNTVNRGHLNPSGTQQIDGDPDLFLDSLNDAVTIQSDGVGWRVLSLYLGGATSV